jgi:hypothetical protein
MQPNYKVRNISHFKIQFIILTTCECDSRSQETGNSNPKPPKKSKQANDKVCINGGSLTANGQCSKISNIGQNSTQAG